MAKAPDNKGRKTSTTHRWAVDRLEEGTAAVEQDGDHVYEIPRWLLPPTARDGDIFTASQATGGDGSITIAVRLDERATEAARAARPKRARPPRDGGGDIVL